MPTLEDVKSFWNKNPLLKGELEQEIGSKEWFEQFDILKRYLMREDRLPLWIGNELVDDKSVLDVGCGPGYWCRALRTSKAEYTGIDISEESIKLALKSAAIFNTSCNIMVGNAESLDFPDNHFDHVISEGVIHHTPNTQQALQEIVRVMKVNGTATISIYYKNIILRTPLLFNSCLKIMNFLQLSMKGRQREKMQHAASVEDFIRMYDGADNPIGKGYTRNDFFKILPRNVTITKSYLYFSPLRAFFRNRLPTFNKILDKYFGLMIAFQIKKTSV